jgi:hypothetical protein
LSDKLPNEVGRCGVVQVHFLTAKSNAPLCNHLPIKCRLFVPLEMFPSLLTKIWARDI